DVLDREAEVLEQYTSRCRLTEGIDTDHTTFETHILVPEVGDTSFNRYARYAFGQHTRFIGSVLTIKHVGRWHGNHTRTHTMLGQLVSCLGCQFDFRTGGNQNDFCILGVTQHIAAAANIGDLLVSTLLEWQVLTRENQGARTVLTFDCL